MAFVLDEGALRHLDDILRKASGSTPKYTVSYRVKASKEDLELGDVLDQANYSMWPVVGIRSRCEATDNNRPAVDVNVRSPLANDPDGDTVEYEVAGREKEFVWISSELSCWCERIQPRYRRIATANIWTLKAFVAAWLVFLVAAWLSTDAQGMAGGVPGVGRIASAWSLGDFRVFIVITSALISVLIGIFGRYLQNRLFPVAVFAIGRGRDRYGDSSSDRRDILTKIATGSMASAAVQVIMRLLTR